MMTADRVMLCDDVEHMEPLELCCALNFLLKSRSKRKL